MAMPLLEPDEHHFLRTKQNRLRAPRRHIPAKSRQMRETRRSRCLMFRELWSSRRRMPGR